ncbi:MAG TPA: hypothetical protein VFO34_07740 [Candidatus Acidoferrales bacterium]|nr:hypothetical protein [Candidatus Acidoferrales bacterium]
MRVENLLVLSSLLIVAGSASTQSAAADSPNSATAISAAESKALVAVYNQAGISQKTVLKAEKITSIVFRDAGLQIEWVNCDTLHQTELDARCSHLSSRARFELHILRKSQDISPAILGLAFVPEAGTGRHADLFYDSVVRMQAESSVDAATILGHVAAHELGHLLIGKEHSRTGLMRANWTREDLGDASRGLLLFSSEESRALQRGLALADAQELPSAHSDSVAVEDGFDWEACCSI